jgi:ankyrin repeat protein
MTTPSDISNNSDAREKTTWRLALGTVGALCVLFMGAFGAVYRFREPLLRQAVDGGSPQATRLLLNMDPSMANAQGTPKLQHKVIPSFAGAIVIPAPGTESLMTEAARQGNGAVAAVFAEKGADTSADKGAAMAVLAAQGDFAALASLLANGARADSPGGAQALSQAARMGREDIVRLLVEHGASVHAKNRALWEAQKKGHERIVEFLMPKRE